MVALPSLCGAAIMWFYFTYVDYSSGVRRPLLDLAVFALVTGTLIGAGLVLGGRRFRPLDLWLDRLRDGADAAAVPPEIRRRALNAPLTNALFTMLSWAVAGAGA